MLKQTYIDKKEELINFVLKSHDFECLKCQEVRHCDPDDYRSESGEFCSSEDCPSLKMMGEARTLADEMEYRDTYGGQELLGRFKVCNMP